jgi:hypothetical protein
MDINPDKNNNDKNNDDPDGYYDEQGRFCIPMRCRDCEKIIGKHTMSDTCMLGRWMRRVMIDNGYTRDLEKLV